MSFRHRPLCAAGSRPKIKIRHPLTPKESIRTITYDTLKKKSILRAYERITPIMPDLNRTLALKPEIKNLNCVETDIDIELIITDDEAKDIPLQHFKHSVENFLHTLTQNGIDLWFSGCYMYSDKPTTFFIKTQVANWNISTVCHSMNVRNLWMSCLIASLIYETINVFHEIEEISKGIEQLSLPTHEMDPKQSTEDTLVETEVLKTAQNTAITQEVDDTTNVHVEHGDFLQEVATTEQLSRLQPIAERFVRVFDTPQTFSITDTPNSLSFEIDLPNGLYSFFDSTIVSALRSYTLIRTDIELLIKINANQAQCGRYIVAAYPRRDQLLSTRMDIRDSVYRMLQRDHALVDVSKSNDVVFTVTYENLRPWLPIQTDEVGTVTGGTFSTVVMRCLSPLRIADTGNPICPYQVFARLKNTVLSGMRFPVSLPSAATSIRTTEVSHEMNKSNGYDPSENMTISGIKDAISSVRAIPIFGPLFGIVAKVGGNACLAAAKLLSSDKTKIQNYEKALNYVGMRNKDRPIDISHPTPLLPTPVHSYAYGRTAFSAKKLRLEPEATVPHVPDHDVVNDTQSVSDIAQIPGLMARFEVNETSSQGDLLIELPAIPYDPRYLSLIPQVAAQTSTAMATIQPPPVTYLFHMFNFYSGSIVYEFVPVKTPSHNFSIQVGFIPFNGDPGDVTEAQLQSCRWKVLDFRTSENNQFTVPWLSNGVMRNMPIAQSSIMSSSMRAITNPNAGLHQTAAFMKDPGKVVVRLVNELNPTPIVSPSIEVLVFVKAHPNLRFLSPTSLRSQLYHPPQMHQFTRIQPLTGEGLGSARNPVVTFTGAQSPINFEMQQFQQGDEQTMGPDVLRDAPGPMVQTLEQHGNLIDISRRFYMHSTVSGIFSAIGPNVTRDVPPFAVVALSPYSQPIQTRAATILVSEQQMPIITPRDAFMACFRWMRGSMVFALHSITDIPLEVTYLPAVDYPYSLSGGSERPTFPFTAGNNVPLFALPQTVGEPAEILEPRLNPIQTFEVPMYNINNYIDVQATLFEVGVRAPGMESRLANLPDLTSLYLGNLVIRGINGVELPIETKDESNFKVRISSALGDDCVLHHFMGVPPIHTPSSLMRYPMVPGTTAFRNRNRTRAEVMTALIAEGVESNPGPTQSFFPSAGLSLNKAFTSATGMMTELKGLISAPKQISNQIDDLKMRGCGLAEQITTVLAAYTTGIELLTLSALAFSILAALSKSTNMFAMLSVITQILGITGVFHASAVANAMTKFSFIFRNDELKHEMESDTIQSMAAVFSSLIMETYFSYSAVDKSKFSVDDCYVKQVFFKTFKNFNIMRTGALCILLTRVCSAVKTLWNTVRKWVRGLEKHDILSDDPEFIRSFMKDYEFFMDERNLAGHSMFQRHRDRFWTTVLTAYYLKSILATVDKKHSNSTLAIAVKEVICKANELKSHMSAPPVRYEPFSMWFWGLPGTGKTTMMLNVSVDMMAEIGVYSGGDPVYVRSPHSVWWNGYNNQPIVMIDDANGVNDPLILGRMISEFQALKTSAKMRIEKPRLEEKDSEMSSLLLGVCSNVPEWISTMIVDKNAFRRRRDVVVEVLWTAEATAWFAAHPEVNHDASSLPGEMTTANRHIVFKLNNPYTNVSGGEVYNYEQLKLLLLKQHREYHAKEIEKMTNRYAKSLALSRTHSDKIMDRATLKSALISVVLGSDSTDVASETMKRTLYELKSASPTRYAELPMHTRNILDTMSQNITHEALGHADSQEMMRTQALWSEWFRNTLFPSYQIGGLFSELSREFRPWNYEEQRAFEMDHITSRCAACRGRRTESRKIAYICHQSAQEGQHWICVDCKPGFDASGVSRCPTCRAEESLVPISMQQQDWRLYSRAAHITKTALKKAAIPLVATADVMWRHASLIAFTSYLTALVYLAYETEKNIARAEELEDEHVKQFVDQFGIVPDMKALMNERVHFLVQRKQFAQNEDGVFEMVDNGVKFEAGKNKDKKKNNENMFQALVDEGVSGRVITHEEVMAARSSKTPPSSVADSLEFKDCDQLVSEADFLNLLKTEACTIAHGDVKIAQAVRKAKQPRLFFEDEQFHMNVRQTGKEAESHKIGILKCESEKCAYNKQVECVVSTFYNQNLLKWTKRREAGEDVFQDENVPQVLQDLFNLEHPEEQVAVDTWYGRMVDYQIDLMKSLKGKILYWFEKIYQQLCEKWHYIMSFIALSFALYYGIKYYYSDDEGVTLEPQHEISSPDRNAGKGKNSEPANTRLYVKRAPASHELHYSINTKVPENVKNVADLIMKNKFSVHCHGFEINGFILKNNIGIFPRHAFSLVKTLQELGEPVNIKTQDGRFTLLKERIGSYVVGDSVIGEWVLLRHNQLTGKDIRGHIFTSIHDEVIYPSYGYGVDLMTQSILPVQYLNVTQNDPDTAPEITTKWQAKDQTFSYTSKMVDYLTVAGFRGEGKCGSPVLNSDAQMIGIHFAGHEVNGCAYGYSAPIFKEMFSGPAFSELAQAKHEMGFPNLKYYSHYPNPPYHTTKTKLQPSAIAPLAWESKTEPCIQSQFDPRYIHGSTPLNDGASTIGAPTNPPNDETLRQATEAVTEEMLRHMPTPSMPAPVSVSEAVSAANHTFVESMNLATSAGLPWIADFPSQAKKSDYIHHTVTKEGEHKVSLSKTFKRKHDVLFEQRLAGTPPREPFWAHLKDERRKPEKLRSFGGTRVINVSPMELVLSCRRALLPFMDAFHARPVQMHHAIGLSPDSVQWTELIESLRIKSDRIVQLDFKKFSDSMPRKFVEAAFEIIKSYYRKYGLLTPELENLLDTIFIEIVQSLICIGGDVYELLNGVLQGHPITTIINSLVNILEQVYVWITLTGLTGEKFFQYCGITVVGDDVVISVPKQFLKRYNGQTIASAFAEMNIVVTDENKNTENIHKWQPFRKFDFLSSSYMLHPYRNLYLTPVDPDSIFDTALWIRRKDGPFLDATHENVEQSLLNSFGHGPCIYEMYRAALEFLTGFAFRSWYELDYIFYKDSGILDPSIAVTNLGVVTGATPKSRDQLGASVGRIERAKLNQHENQYWDVDFLANVELDTQGIEAGKYACKCRYDCEKELMKRIHQVECKTGTPRAHFLPFISQEAGTRILGARINTDRIAKSRGCASTKAVKGYEGGNTDSAIGTAIGIEKPLESFQRYITGGASEPRSETLSGQVDELASG